MTRNRNPKEVRGGGAHAISSRQNCVWSSLRNVHIRAQSRGLEDGLVVAGIRKSEKIVWQTLVLGCPVECPLVSLFLTSLFSLIYPARNSFQREEAKNNPARVTIFEYHDGVNTLFSNPLAVQILTSEKLFLFSPQSP